MVRLKIIKSLIQINLLNAIDEYTRQDDNALTAYGRISSSRYIKRYLSSYIRETFIN